MCRKLLFLIALLGLVGIAWGDDLYPPSWRGDPGTTVSKWTYDQDAPNPVVFPRFDIPDVYSFWSHPEKEDPKPVQVIYEEAYEGDYPGYGPFGAAFSWQLWAESDSGAPMWMPTFVGRTGVLYTDAGSWDLNNFIHDQPLKDMYVQITYTDALHSGNPVDFMYELEYLSPMQWSPFEWIPSEWFEGFWDDTFWIPGFWIEGFWEGGWEPPVGFEEGDLVFTSEEVLGDGWIHSVFELALSPNPEVEYLGLFPAIDIVIDQIIIDTICYVPEPATILLLGLGGLALLRKRRT